jgi:hypothetical protein
MIVDEKVSENIPSFSFLVITNRPQNFKIFINSVRRYGMPVLAVTDGNPLFDTIDTSGINLKTICTRSTNFSYMINLARAYITTKYYFYLGDDETLEGRLDNILQMLSDEPESISFIVESSFNGKKINMWKREVPKLFATNVRFVKSIHELPVLSKEPKFCGEIRILNKSYKSWSEYWQKAIKFSKGEIKSLSRFVNLLITPIYWFFKKGGWVNGLLSMELVVSSIIYAFLSIINGKNKYYGQISLVELKHKYKKNLSCISENDKEYISNKLFSLEIEGKNLDYKESIDQLVSALEN